LLSAGQGIGLPKPTTTLGWKGALCVGFAIENRPVLCRQRQRIGEQPNGLFPRRSALACLKRGDAAGAHTGPLGKLLLRQSSRQPVAPEQIAEGCRLIRIHSPHPQRAIV